MGEATWKELLRARRLLQAEQFEQARTLLSDRDASSGFLEKSLFDSVYWQVDRALRDRGLNGARTLTEALTLLVENPPVKVVPLTFRTGLTWWALLGLGVLFCALALDLVWSGPQVRDALPLVVVLGVLFVVPRRVVTRLLITKHSFGYAGVGAPLAAVAELRSGNRRVTSPSGRRNTWQRIVVITLRDGQKLEVFADLPWAAKEALLEAGVNAVYTSDEV
jgi:hypothetical protein